MTDTRKKIVDREAARALARDPMVRVVTGYFDPMLPGQVARLRELAGDGALLVVVVSPEDWCLEAGARAELAAALSFVKAVVIGDGALAAELQAYREHPEEGRMRAEFFAFVRERAAQKV